MNNDLFRIQRFILFNTRMLLCLIYDMQSYVKLIYHQYYSEDILFKI